MNKQLTFKLEHPIEELIPAMIEFNNSELLQRRARFYQELAEELPVRE